MTDDDDLRLDASLRRSLDRARAQLEPTSDCQAELFAQITLALDAGVLPDGSASDAPTAPGLAAAPTVSMKALVVSGVTTAVLGTAVAYHFLNVPSASVPSDPPPVVAQSAEPQAEEAAPPEIYEAINRPPEAPTPPRPLAPKKSDTSVENTAETPPELLGLSDELSHVRRAQGALRDGDPALALQLMQSLDAKMTSGALLAERGVTRVLALCALGQQADAEHAARVVLERADGAVYRKRLAASCAKRSLAPEPSDENKPPGH